MAVTLLPGDCIGIMAPSNCVDRKVLLQSKAMLEARGFQVYIHPQTWTKLNQSAGTGPEKAAALHDLVRRKDIKAIFFARGGNRAGTMLEHLDFKLIAKHPKLYLGYSDITVLLNSINLKTGLATYHGPMSHGLISLPKKQVQQCFDLLAGKATPIAMPKAKVIKPGTVRGKLIGGNLSMLCSLLGTPWQPDFKNAILFVEDVAEETSRIDRSLRHLRNAGILKQINGLMLGSFADSKDTGKMKYGFKLEDCVRAVTEGYKYPVLMNAPFGHGNDLYTFPVGHIAHLTSADKQSVLTL